MPPFFVGMEEGGERGARTATMTTNWCYVLRSDDGRGRYVGMTVDPARRIRQHNGELVGGARRTRTGRPWTFAALFWGFRDIRDAMRAEWRLKRLGRGRRGASGVLSGLRDELRSAGGEGRWTASCEVPYGDQRLNAWLAPDTSTQATDGLGEAMQAVGWFLETSEDPPLLGHPLVSGPAPAAFIPPLTPNPPPAPEECEDHACERQCESAAHHGGAAEEEEEEEAAAVHHNEKNAERG